MRATIDSSGRIVVPASLREHLGIVPGPVEITVDGASIRIDIPAAGKLVERDRRLVVRGAESSLTTDEIRQIRLADQR